MEPRFEPLGSNRHLFGAGAPVHLRAKIVHINHLNQLFGPLGRRLARIVLFASVDNWIQKFKRCRHAIRSRFR
ncbi:hypothetical protein EMIT0P12_120037 [Pseudomonas sp. IT-P12]